MTFRAAFAGIVLAGLTLTACGGSEPPAGPTDPPVTIVPTVLSVAPVSGPTAGGTEVTISGVNFAAGAVVTIGGAAAANVRVSGSTKILAVTGPHAAGAVDVTVAVDGRSSTLSSAFTYATAGPNALPVITAITVQSTQPNAPSNFADLSEDVPVTATVTDAETPPSQLAYDWSATLGTFTGTGASVRWRAPAAASTPTAVTITLKVTESLAGGAGTQSASKTATVRLHNSAKEIRDMSYQFLLEFSQQSPAPEQIVRNFYTGCPGRNDELSDVTNNQKNFKINSYSVATSFPVTINFSSKCPYQNKSGDGCAQVPVQWKSTCLSSDPLVCTKGLTYTTTGTDQTTAVYRQDRWWLCDSNFNGSASSPYLPGFIR
jgi:hypothetical protein